MYLVFWYGVSLWELDVEGVLGYLDGLVFRELLFVVNFWRELVWFLVLQVEGFIATGVFCVSIESLRATGLGFSFLQLFVCFIR